jgi:hypothetical protein
VAAVKLASATPLLLKPSYRQAPEQHAVDALRLHYTGECTCPCASVVCAAAAAMHHACCQSTPSPAGNVDSVVLCPNREGIIYTGLRGRRLRRASLHQVDWQRSNSATVARHCTDTQHQQQCGERMPVPVYLCQCAMPVYLCTLRLTACRLSIAEVAADSMPPQHC